jgi:hypothetical protein
MVAVVGAASISSQLNTSLGKRNQETIHLSEADTEPKKSKRSIQPHMTNHFKSLTSEHKVHLDDEVAKFFYSCNIAFIVAEHPQWKKLVGMLRPGYTPPSSRRIGNELLSKITEEQN